MAAIDYQTVFARATSTLSDMTGGIGATSGAGHWAALDGLRGLAVVAVLLYHAFPATSPNGFAGVDVFFVLSGFLITSLLLRERARLGQVSLRNFYIRRILRLYPALVVAAVAILLMELAKGELRAAIPGAVSALVYMAHVTIGFGIDSRLLSHTWTLSLEEHYYVVWPAILLGLLVRGWRRWVAAGALVAVLALALPGLLPSGVAAMYWRGLPMLVGSGLALMMHFRPIGRGHWAAVVGLVSLCMLTVVVLTPVPIGKPFLQGPFGVPTFLSVLVIVGFVLSGESVGARILSFSPLVELGKRAYGLYLYHFPIVLGPIAPTLFSAIGFDLPWIGDMLIGLAITLIVAWLSYRWIESPFLRLKERFRRTSPAADLSTTES